MIEASTNCPYCIGYTDSSGFHHAFNCPNLDNHVSLTVNPNNEILSLLRSIDFTLQRIKDELETIRMRTK